MAVTRTFSIIKPDATRRNITGAVTKMLEDAGLRVVASKRIHMTKEQAEGFYAVHKERPFFGELVEFMTSGPVVVQVLEGENAMQRNRDVMGATKIHEPFDLPDQGVKVCFVDTPGAGGALDGGCVLTAPDAAGSRATLVLPPFWPSTSGGTSRPLPTWTGARPRRSGSAKVLLPSPP